MAIAGIGQKVQVAPRWSPASAEDDGIWFFEEWLDSAASRVVGPFKPDPRICSGPPFLRLIRSLLGSTADWLFNILEIVMSTGTVKWFNPTKGYGFIQPQGGGQDVFVHISAVERAGLNTLNEGQHIEYEIVSNRGKSSAENLRVR
jgi:cold shock protein